MNDHRYSWDRMNEVPTRAIRIHPGEPATIYPSRRNRRRLSGVDYARPDCICLVTVCTDNRRPIFSDTRAAQVAQEILLERQKSLGYRLDAYVILPDHAHLVIAPGAAHLTIGRIVGGWKSLVARRLWEIGIVRSPWQRDFDDRVLRAGEKRQDGYAAMIRYVLENPVRRGLATHWWEYPYCACFVPTARIL